MESKVIPVAGAIGLISIWVWPAGYLGLAIGILCAIIAAERHFR